MRRIYDAVTGLHRVIELYNAAGRKKAEDRSFDCAYHQQKFRSVETINSIYSFITGVSYKSEIIIVNIDKEGYKYDRLLSNFPALRILLPQEKIPLKDAFFLAAQESLSKYILFIDESFKIRSIDMELLETYLQEQNFGIILPVITDAKDDTIPNIMKGSVSEGFLTTISVDMKGIALSSLYSKYLCFI